MKLSCRKCGEEISAENMEPRIQIATCAICEHVFDYSQQAAIEFNFERAFATTPPNNIEVFQHKASLIIRWPWRDLTTYVVGGFALLLDVFMAIMIGNDLVEAAQTGELGGLLFYLIFPFFWAAVWLTYLAIGLYFNSTTISADFDFISVAHGPIPWTGHVRVDRHDVLQLYSRRIRPHDSGFSYELHALMRDNQSKRLAMRLGSTENAQFIESTLEVFYGILDEPIEGEILSDDNHL